MTDLIDLHTHSTESDGTCTPAELVRRAAALGLRALGLTDHDTVAGLAEARAAADHHGIEFVPGIEISAVHSPDPVHILGYLIDPDHPRIREVAGLYVAGRHQRNRNIINRLAELGCPVTIEQVAQRAGGQVVGRPHIAEALVAEGYVASIQQAFDRYLRRGGPAYFHRFRLTPTQAVQAIHESGGLAVLAHPSQLGAESDTDLRRIVLPLKDLGLDGIEVYHSEHQPDQVARYMDLARSLDLLMTGGSDFHGDRRPDIRLGCGTGRVAVPYEILERLRAAADDRSTPRLDPGAPTGPSGNEPCNGPP